ncbi:lysophospholipid acyltransferase family protein [Flectobacillus longus]|uniref:lysophospholipid acyltransferase family protein n=1 Tax=Flectobacillus longus TaxID=2984207 RepID=UPI0024B6FA91|nr:lysophospholipid acyltransferase family protein [Flectobacillus longus]MDI9879867.1 lysophospholipid acyltransferase family protein [Flectobacillus longus]
MLFFRLLSRLPMPVLYVFSDFLFFVSYYLIKYRRKVVIMNLQNSFPEKTAKEHQMLAKAFYHNLCDVIVESLKLLTISVKDLEKMVEINGQEVIDECLRNNEVMLIMSSHINCWELVPPRTTQTGVPIDVIYKPLSSPFFDKLMYTIRSRFNITPIPMKQTFREMVKKKGQPRIVGIISDQAAETPDLAYWTTFLHQETDFFLGTEKMARSFNYPILYGEMVRKRRGRYVINYSLLVERPYEQYQLGKITEIYARTLEKSILENPSDWLWSHRRFKHKRSK